MTSDELLTDTMTLHSAETEAAQGTGGDGRGLPAGADVTGVGEAEEAMIEGQVSDVFCITEVSRRADRSWSDDLWAHISGLDIRRSSSSSSLDVIIKGDLSNPLKVSLQSIDPYMSALASGEPHTIRVHTSDNAIVHVPYYLLVKHSAFIADLPDFQAETVEKGFMDLPLLSASSGGMILLLKLLLAKEYSRGGPGDSSPWRTVDMLTLQHIVDALIIADAYLTPLFPRILLNSALEHLSRKHLLLWSVYALAGREDRLQELQIRMLQPVLAPIPPEAEAVLEKYAPDAFAALLEMRKGWTASTEALLLQLSSLAPIFGGNDDYGRACRTGGKVYKGRGGWHCLGYKRQPDWAELRKEAAEAVYNITTAPVGSRASLTSTAYAIHSVVPCRKCKTRLSGTFAHPIKNFQTETKRYRELPRVRLRPDQAEEYRKAEGVVMSSGGGIGDDCLDLGRDWGCYERDDDDFED